MNSTIQLYDATLRDGMGGGGMSLTAQEKLRIVERLDQLGVDMIEAGFPSSNPKEAELFELLAAAPLEQAQIVAFGMTRRRDTAAEDDEGLRVLVASIATAVTLVGKSSMLHVEKVIRVTPAENLAMIEQSIAFVAAAGKRTLFDAEHFFDGWRQDAGYALETLRAAVAGGAERVVLCDTNGGALPSQVREVVLAVCDALPGVPVGIHTHDDGGCAVANSLVAIEAGATQVQGTVNGIGERTGNANLITIIADLQLKMGIEVLPEGRLSRLTETAHFVDELLNRAPNAAQPYVGKNAFAHKAGMHAAGVSAESSSFEHVDPTAVGNSSEVIVSELAGRATIIDKGQRAGLELDPQTSGRIVDRVKQLEHQGYQFEAADGSFELLMRRESGHYQQLFEVDRWKVTVEQQASGEVSSEATIVIRIDGRCVERTASGNGPVNALDSALRSAITEAYPALGDVELVNYKVRILDEAHGTDAVTRVLIDASDGERVWGTIGVGENVIAASWQALVDSLEFAHQTDLRRDQGSA